MFRDIILKEWEASEEQESPGNQYDGDCVTLLRKADGTLNFWRTEHQLRRFDNYLSPQERALVDRVWPPREKFICFNLIYVPTPGFVTKTEVMRFMGEQNMMFLDGIERLVKQLVVPARQELAITSAKNRVIETLEPKKIAESQPKSSRSNDFSEMFTEPQLGSSRGFGSSEKTVEPQLGGSGGFKPSNKSRIKSNVAV